MWRLLVPNVTEDSFFSWTTGGARSQSEHIGLVLTITFELQLALAELD